MITLAKRGDLHARRQALAVLQDKDVAHRLFDEQKDRFLNRQGGYVRIVKKETRKGDGAPISIIQLLPEEGAKKKAKKGKKEASAKSEKTKSKETKEGKQSSAEPAAKCMIFRPCLLGVSTAMVKKEYFQAQRPPCRTIKEVFRAFGG
jgi:large subunit ribosomal protein L17